MVLPKIYKLTSSGKIQTWEIEINENSYRTISGQKGGKLTTSEPTVCKGKNTGKANATTGEEQAFKEATAKRQLKLEKEYKETEEACTGDVGYIKPMRAKQYEDYKDVLVFPVYSDKKYNGMRCVISAKGMYSRNGKVVVAAPHIYAALRPLFAVHPDLVLDGELYNHTLHDKLNRILEIVRLEKPTPEELAESEQTVQFYVYDGYNFPNFIALPGGTLMEDGTVTKDDKFAKRKNNLGLLLLADLDDDSRCIVFTHTDFAENQEQLDGFYKQYLKDNYEGQMVRLDEPYQNKETKFLLKRKEMKDAEFEIESVIQGEGNRAGTAGAFWLKLPSPFVGTDGKTRTRFKANIKGEYDYLKKLWAIRATLPGKFATVQFQQYSEYGIPIFPYVTAIRDYE